MFDRPLLIVGPAFILSVAAAALSGLLLVRRFVLPRLRVKVSDSEFIGAMVQSVMVFYGLALALIAVNVWQTYKDVSGIVSHEAEPFPALYRDISGYPEPTRGQLQGMLREYFEQVIHEAWPQMHKGQVPTGGV